MSSYATLYANGTTIGWWRNEIDPTFLFLFSAEDVGFGRDAALAAELPGSIIDEYEEYDNELCVLSVKASQLHDRLNALGISSTAARRMFEQVRAEAIDLTETFSERTGTEIPPQAKELADLRAYSYEAWMADVSEQIATRREDSRRVDSPYDRMRADLEYVDPRYTLRAYVDALSPDAVVALDVTDLVEGGWVERGLDPHAIALEHYQG